MSTGSTTGSASLRASPAAMADAPGPGLPRASTSLSSSTGSSGSSVIRSASALTDAQTTPRRSVPALRPTHGHMRHPSNTVIDMGGFSWDDHGSSALAAASAGAVVNGDTPPIAEDLSSAATMGASGLPGASPTTPGTVTVGPRGTPGARTGGARSKVQHLLSQFQDHEYAAAAGAPASVAYYSRHVAGPPPPLSLDRARGMAIDDQVGPSSAPLRAGSRHHPTPPGATATVEHDLGASELGTVLDMSLLGFPGAADPSRPSTAGTAATYGMSRLSLGHEPPADATGILPGAMPVMPHLVQREETSNRSHASLLTDDYNPTTATSYADSPFPIEDHFVMDADHQPPPPGAYLHHTPPTSSTTVASAPGTSGAAAYYARYPPPPPPPTLPMPVTSGGHPSEFGHQLDWPIAPTQLFGYAPAAPPPPPPPQAVLASPRNALVGGVPPPPPPATHHALRAPPPPPLSATAASRPPNGLDGSGAHRRSPSASSSSAVRMLPASGMASAAVMAPGNTAQPTSARASRGSALGLAPASASGPVTRPPASPTRGLSWTEHDGGPSVPPISSGKAARTSRMSFLAPGTSSGGGGPATSGTNSGPGSGSATPTGGARARSRSPMAAVASAFASLLKSPNTGSAPLLPTAGGAGGARGNAGSSPRTSAANLGTSGETAGGLSPPATTGSRRKSLRQSLTGVLSAVTAKSADELRGTGGGGGGTAGRTKSPYDATAANGSSPQASARAVSFADASGRPTSRTYSRSASGADARAKTSGDANGKADPAAAAAPASTSSGKKSRTPVQQLQFSGARRDLRAYVAARGLESPWTVMQSTSRRPKSTSSSAVSSAAATAAAALLGPTGGGSGVRGRNGAAMDHRKSVVRRSRDSLLCKLTMLIVDTYRDSNPAFHYTPRANPRRVLTKPSKPMRNDGYDNEDNDYILYVNDTLGDDADRRYVIIDLLGQGTFGQVVKCQNLKTKEIVAVKVIKNKPAYFNQSLTEVKVLELLNHKYDKNDTHHILRLKDSFVFRRHLCLVFEQLSINLYELIKQNQFRGLSLKLVRVFTAQILDALVCLAEAKLIHADLKPENLLLKNAHDTQIKVIDLGSACQEQQTVYTYIQSRFYRSPEVLLGLPYTNAIDMWSLGCIVAELFLGLPLFPGTSEYNQVSRIVDMLGMPPTYMIEVGKNAKAFFVKIADGTPAAGPHAPRIPAVYRLKPREQYAKEHGTTEQPSKRYFAGTTLAEVVMQYPYSRRLQGADLDNERRTRECLLDFLGGLLHLNPIERWSAAQARMHPFISGAPWRGPWTPTAATAALAANRGNDATASVPSSATVQQDAAHDAELGHRTLRKRAKTISTGPTAAAGSASTGHLPAVGPGPMLPPHMVVGTDPATDDAAAAAERQQRRKSSIADLTAATQNRVRKVSSYETMAAAAAAAASDPSAQQQQGQQVPPHPYAVSTSGGSLMGGSQSTGSLLQSNVPVHGAGGETLGIPILRKGRSQSISVGVGGVGIGPGSSATIMSAAAGWPYWPPPPPPAHMHAQDLAMATPGTYPGLGEFDQQRYAAYVQQQQQQQQQQQIQQQQHLQQQQAAGVPSLPPRGSGYYGTSYQHNSSMMHHMAAAAVANQRTMQGFGTGGAPPPAGYGSTRGAYYSGPSTSMPPGGPILPTWNPTNSRVIPAHLEYTGGATTDDEEWRDIEEGYMGASPGPDTPAGTPSTAPLTGPVQHGMVVPGGFPSSTSSLGSPATSAASASAARRASLAAAAVAAAASGALLPPPQGISPSMLAAAATPGTFHHAHHQQPYPDQVVGMSIPGSFGPSGGMSGTGGTAPRFHMAPQQSPLRTTLGDESAAAGSSSELSTIQEQPLSTSLPK